MNRKIAVRKGGDFCYNGLMKSLVTWVALVGIVPLLGTMSYCLLQLAKERRPPESLRKLSKLTRVALLTLAVGAAYRCVPKVDTNGVRGVSHEVNPSSGRINPVRSGDDGDSQLAAITNLCFSQIAVSSRHVSLNVAWPTNLFATGALLDLFAKHPALTNGWSWVESRQIASGETNAVFVVDAAAVAADTNAPAAMFFKIQDRATCATTMRDSDGDGIPDIYELRNGTNPYVDDFAAAPRLTVGPDGDYPTLAAALSASTNYSVIALSTGIVELAKMVTMPPHPVLVTGPRNGYSVLRSESPIAAFMLDGGQNSETRFRNLQLVLGVRSGFQAGFWIGGNLPWIGEGASPSFENVRIRAPYPDVLYYGWHYYRDDGGASMVSNCVMNAAGATAAVGVYALDGPVVDMRSCAFVNFPTNGYATYIKRGVPLVTESPAADTNLTWSGYRLDAEYGSQHDSDGDGISDDDEIRIHGTDPWLADSDGDGVSDSDEIAAGTDPKNVYSFRRSAKVVVEATDELVDVTNYVAWGTSATGWETNGLIACAALPATNTYAVLATDGPLYLRSYRDLNRNGQYDEDDDVLLVEEVPYLASVSSTIFKFGDIDRDGVDDVVERREGTDPYNALEFRFRTVVSCVDSDHRAAVTNHLAAGLQMPMFPSPGEMTFSESGSLSIDMVVTNGECVVGCLRDFNGNGQHDEGTDVLVSRRLTKDDNGKTVQWTLGDSDGDGQSDSVELSHGTDPRNPASHCFNLYLVETGIFSTTNQLTAEIRFGTNVVVGPVIMTNRTWEVNVGHLTTTNRERVVVCFWDDANSNRVCDVDECWTRHEVFVRGHDNVVTNALAYGGFDQDKDNLPDWWELRNGLPPNGGAADEYADPDHDGLINLHEFMMDTNPVVPDGSNTFQSICSRSVDERIRNVCASNVVGRFVAFFENAPMGQYVANTNFWLRNVDVSCASVWNVGGEPGSMSATAITRRHVIMSAHWYKTSQYFCATNGQLIGVTVVALHGIAGSDMLLGRLASDLPTSIKIPKVLDEDLADAISGFKYLPIVCINQRKEATVLEMESLNVSAVNVDNGILYHNLAHTSSTNLVSDERLSIRGATIDGNSGSPCFLLVEDELVYLFSKHLGYKNQSVWSPSWGPLISHHLVDIQNTINAWEGGNAGSYQMHVIHLDDVEVGVSGNGGGGR